MNYTINIVRDKQIKNIESVTAELKDIKKNTIQMSDAMILLFPKSDGTWETIVPKGLNPHRYKSLINTNDLLDTIETLHTDFNTFLTMLKNNYYQQSHSIQKEIIINI